jgi:hypothetical protein
MAKWVVVIGKRVRIDYIALVRVARDNEIEHGLLIKARMELPKGSMIRLDKKSFLLRHRVMLLLPRFGSGTRAGKKIHSLDVPRALSLVKPLAVIFDKSIPN